MFVYLVVYGIPYESEQTVGVFSDLDKARQLKQVFEDSFGYTQIVKVEVDKVYEAALDGIGEEV